MPEKDWLNISEAAEYLGVSRQTVYNLIERGILPYTELRGVRGKRIKKEDLAALFKRTGGESKPKGKSEK